MFKSRKPTPQIPSTQNPRIDFEYGELVKAAKLLLGKETADKLLEAAFKSPKEGEQRNEKDFLKLLTITEHWARYYRDNPNEEAKYILEDKENQEQEEADAPYFVPKSRNKPKDPKAIRNHYAHEFLQITSLRSERSFRLNLPYRIRCEAQYKHLNSNHSEIVRHEKAQGTENEYKLRIHLCTKDLPKITSALQSGKNTFNIDLPAQATIPNKNMPVEIVWTDETPHRPELARQIFGRQTDKLFEEGKEGLHALGRTERGACIHLIGGTNCKANFTKLAGNSIQINLEPQVEVKPHGFEAFENEVVLMEYFSEQYGCSPAEFIKSIPNITKALEENLEKAARQWLKTPQGESLSQEDKISFLQQYTEIALTLPTIPTPIGSISVNRLKEWEEIQASIPKKPGFQKAKNSKELLSEIKSFLSPETSTAPALEKPFLDAIETLQEEAFGSIASVNPGASISKEMVETIAQSSIQKVCKTPNPDSVPDRLKSQTERAARANESVASALGISPEELENRRTLLVENFYQTGKGKELDGVPQKAIFQTYSLSEEEREDFYKKQDYFNQKEFESKGDTPLGPDGEVLAKPELAGFIANQNTIPLEIPSSPQSLHRMTRYPTGARSKGKDIARFPYGHPKHLPKDRGQKNNAIQELKLNDFLSQKGQEAWAAALEEGNENTLKQMEDIKKTLNEQWNRGYGLILPAKPNNPVDARAVQWFNALLRAKREGIPAEEKKANSIGEIFYLFKCLSKIAGMKVGGIDTPLQTQPMPSISSSIPLQLLCGVEPKAIKELEEIHQNPIELRDLQARWENGLMADIFNPPTLEKEEKELEEIISKEKPKQRLRNLEAILQNPTNYLQDFYKALGLQPQGSEEPIPKELVAYREILPLLKSSPLTLTIQGEEMNLSTTLDVATQRMQENAAQREQYIQKLLENSPQEKREQILEETKSPEKEILEEFLRFTQEENQQIESSLQRRALDFKQNLEKISNTLIQLSKESNPLKPSGSKSEERVLEIPTQEKDTLQVDSISQGLSEALVASESEDEKSGRARVNFLKETGTLLTNPDITKITIKDPIGEELSIEKNPQGIITISGKPEKSEKLLAAKELALLISGNPPENPDKKIQNLAENILTDAKAGEIRKNATKIQEALFKIPPTTSKAMESNREAQEANARISMLIKLEKVEKALRFQIENWGHFEDTQTGSIESSQVVFDFSKEMENITKKAFGSDPELENTKKEFLEQFSQPARQTFLNQGEKATKLQLKQNCEFFFSQEKGKISKEAGNLLKTIAAEIKTISGEITPEGTIKKDSTREELKAAFQPEGLFHKICSISETNSILLKKLKTAEQLTQKVVLSRKKEEPKPKEVLPKSISSGTKSPGIIEISGQKAKTNKIWIKDVLESPKGQELLELSRLASAWVSEPKEQNQRKERLALMVYLKVQGVQKEAILATKSPEGKATLEEIAQKWSEKLATLGCKNRSINELLATTSTLNLVTGEDLIGKTLLEKIEKEGLKNPPSKKLQVEIQEGPWGEKAIKIPSAFLKGEELSEEKRKLDKGRQEESKGQRIRNIRGATDVLHKKEAEELARI